MAKRRKGARRSSARSSKRRSSGRSLMSGWVPLSGQEIAIDFVVGAVAGPLSAKLKPVQEQYLGPVFGPYSDEAALAIVGSVAHKFGSGYVKLAGRELFRVAVISAGNQIGSSTVAGMLGNN